MIIERLKKEDLIEYKNLIDEAFDESNDIEQYYKYDDKSLNYEIIVAKIDNKIVGSLTMYKLDLFTFSFQPTIEIFNVAVLKEYRKQNIGKCLLEYVKKYAKENGYKQICLTCLDSALPAHRLYESVGMEKANSIKYNLYLD